MGHSEISKLESGAAGFTWLESGEAFESGKTSGSHLKPMGVGYSLPDLISSHIKLAAPDYNLGISECPKVFQNPFYIHTCTLNNGPISIGMVKIPRNHQWHHNRIGPANTFYLSIQDPIHCILA